MVNFHGKPVLHFTKNSQLKKSEPGTASNPHGQPRPHGVRCVWTTYAGPGSLLFIQYRPAFRGSCEYKIAFGLNMAWPFSCNCWRGCRYLAIIEWGWVGCEEFCRSRRITSAEIFIILHPSNNTGSSKVREMIILQHTFLFEDLQFLLAIEALLKISGREGGHINWIEMIVGCSTGPTSYY